ncbi:hypothetical protein J6590_100311 [Homalodisca vitripennis]|nr:hypothetical protein J6590_092403 [Homalodisca vitripennis]KAG8327420.1 hypothetical protein J6590_020122 [Homalodisca vitripennis]KAG8328846.1 hypothetical protein J6590_100311 [Homalodisca vitripennis]
MIQTYAVPGLMTFAENFQELYFQHDGAPPHYATAVRDYLNERFQRKFIVRRADIYMPPRSPDITPMDFSYGEERKVVTVVWLRSRGSEEKLTGFRDKSSQIAL